MQVRNYQLLSSIGIPMGLGPSPFCDGDSPTNSILTISIRTLRKSFHRNFVSLMGLLLILYGTAWWHLIFHNKYRPYSLSGNLIYGVDKTLFLPFSKTKVNEKKIQGWFLNFACVDAEIIENEKTQQDEKESNNENVPPSPKKSSGSLLLQVHDEIDIDIAY